MFCSELVPVLPRWVEVKWCNISEAIDCDFELDEHDMITCIEGLGSAQLAFLVEHMLQTKYTSHFLKHATSSVATPCPSVRPSRWTTHVEIRYPPRFSMSLVSLHDARIGDGPRKTSSRTSKGGSFR